ncbi:NAD(P)-dependent oxidoreductase [Prauserella cavernicola]|uniref:NAD(P)-dependent oxidoreductase n=1 Tax=Prauserella cavernicola TaxID=2800127 RepID=A0A934R260_9PSEU|nr:NAD(P)-dependent oxidoreductase [Prauserella cavernicola]MBK1789443.1 NAD(P)-dependent oxidoreductase [Prauserella cavernicola]
MNRSVLFVGLGAMGAPIAANLARADGVTLSGFDPDQTASLPGDVPWTRVEQLSDGISPDTVVFLCLPSIREVEQVCRDLVDARPRCVVDLSTSDPERTRVVARSLAEHGIAFCDAPVARGRQAAVSGELLMMVGGEADVAAELDPLFSEMACTIVHCGPVGSGQTVKILNNMVLLMNVHTLAEAAAVAGANGLDVATVLGVLREGSSGSFALSGDAGQALIDDSYPAGRFSVDYALKDIRLAVDLAGRAGPMPGLAAAEELLDRASRSGLGEHYYPAMVRVATQERSNDGPER